MLWVFFPTCTIARNLGFPCLASILKNLAKHGFISVYAELRCVFNGLVPGIEHLVLCVIELL